jgi:hypothetical protein
LTRSNLHEESRIIRIVSAVATLWIQGNEELKRGAIE